MCNERAKRNEVMNHLRCIRDRGSSIRPWSFFSLTDFLGTIREMGVGQAQKHTAESQQHRSGMDPQRLVKNVCMMHVSLLLLLFSPQIRSPNMRRRELLSAVNLLLLQHFQKAIKPPSTGRSVGIGLALAVPLQLYSSGNPRNCFFNQPLLSRARHVHARDNRFNVDRKTHKTGKMFSNKWLA